MIVSPPAASARDERLDPAERQAATIGDRIGQELEGAGVLTTGALPEQIRGLAERHLGVDLSGTELRADSSAAERAASMNALAVTEGARVSFARSELSLRTRQSRALLGHELTHVAQQKQAGSPSVQRQLSPAACAPGKVTSINADSLRARGMLAVAAAKLTAYHASLGIGPASVRSAMGTHFGTTLSPFAAILAAAAAAMLVQSHAMATTTLYSCIPNGTWPCGSGTLAWAPWCLPGPIVVCDPKYFTQTEKERSATLIHEWAHKFWCRLDLGYEGTPDYPSNFLTASLNADNFAALVRDLN